MNTQEKIAIGAVIGFFLLVGSCIGRDIHRENSREYQLVCTGGFKSEWGRRVYSESRVAQWWTPSGSYIQKPGETCKSYYRLKDVANQ